MTDNIVLLPLNQYNVNWGTGIILYKNGKILVAKRTDNGLYGGVGGKVEIGESPIQGAIRECLEESNIEIYKMSFLGSFEHSSPNGKKWLSFNFFSNDFNDSKVVNQESEMGVFEWKDINEINQLELFPPFKQSIQLASQLGVLNSTENISYIEAPNIPSKVKDSPSCQYSYVVQQDIFNPWADLPPWFEWD